MRNVWLPVLALSLIAGCSPQTYSLSVEMSLPSASGINFAGKSIAVAYVQGDPDKDAVFASNVAEGFASSIESDYFNGEQCISIYKIDRDSSAVYSSRDTLVNLVMDTGRDIVFLFDAARFGELNLDSSFTSVSASPDSAKTTNVTVPFSLDLYVYDSMGKRDTVRTFLGKSSISQPVYTSRDGSPEDAVWSSLADVSRKAGELAARNFKPKWVPEQYTLLYYEAPEAWETAIYYSIAYDWAKAIDCWLDLVKSKNELKRSCAEYNIATALYMLGDYSLALEWLDRSDADHPISLSSGLRKRIVSRMGM